MRWRGPARFCYANYRLLGVCRCSTGRRGQKPARIPGFPVLPALPESPPAGPRFRRQEISTASASPAQEVCADNLKKTSYPHAHPHLLRCYPPSRRILHRSIHSSVHSRQTITELSSNRQAAFTGGTGHPGPANRTSAVPRWPGGSIEPRSRLSAMIRARLKPLPGCGPASRRLHHDRCAITSLQGRGCAIDCRELSTCGRGISRDKCGHR
jgi:hypothetical protein